MAIVTGLGLFARMQHQRKFAAGALAAGGQPGAQVLRRHSGNFLKLFGQFTAHGDPALAQRHHGAGQRFNAVRRLQNDNRARVGLQGLHGLIPFQRFGRQEAGKNKSRATLDAGHTQRSRHTAGAGQGQDA